MCIYTIACEIALNFQSRTNDGKCWPRFDEYITANFYGWWMCIRIIKIYWACTFSANKEISFYHRIINITGKLTQVVRIPWTWIILDVKIAIIYLWIWRSAIRSWDWWLYQSSSWFSANPVRCCRYIWYAIEISELPNGWTGIGRFNEISIGS